MKLIRSLLSRTVPIGLRWRARKSYSDGAAILVTFLLILTALLAKPGAIAQIPAACQPGALDTSFSTDGKVTTAIGTSDDSVSSVAIQADGKIVAGGYSLSSLMGDDFAVVRYNNDGSLDTSFNGTGKVTTDIGGSHDVGYSLVIQIDGKIVVVGSSLVTSSYDFAIVRYNSDGTLDASFNGTGKVTTPIGSFDDNARSVAIQADGKIIAAGYSSNGTDNDFAVVRYNSDGSLDTSFNGTGKVITPIGSSTDEGYSVAIQTDGKIVVAGGSVNGSSYDFAVVRYNSDGSLDTSFNGTGKVITPIGSSDDIAESLVIQTDGKIVVAGNMWNGANHDFAVVRYNSNGSLDTTFNGTGKVTTDIGGGSDDDGFGVAIDRDDKIVVAGYSLGTTVDFAVVRYNNSGSLDTSFNGTGKVITPVGSSFDFGFAVAIDGNNKIVVAGTSLIGSNYDVAVVRYVGSCATPTPTPSPTPTPTPLPRVTVTATSAQITEGQTSTYRVRASSAVAQDTTVPYTMSGTATLGSDYTLNPPGGQVTILAGQSTALVKLKAKTDGLTEGTETAIMTLQPGSGYRLGNPKQATVSILDSP